MPSIICAHAVLDGSCRCAAWILEMILMSGFFYDTHSKHFGISSSETITMPIHVLGNARINNAVKTS